MPLIEGKSNEARSENIKRELEAHPQMKPEQAEAIAYAVQRKAKDCAMDSAHVEAVQALHRIADSCMGRDRKR